MPIHYSRKLTGRDRSKAGNTQLGCILASRVEKPKQVKHPIQDQAQHMARQSLSTNNIMTGSPSSFNPVSARREQRRAIIALD